MPVKAQEKQKSKGSGRLSAVEMEALPDRLLDAAYQLFSTQGYAGTRMEEIAKNAGASTKTLYSRYANKAEIMSAVVRRMIETVVADHQMQTSVDPRGIEPHTFLTSLGKQISYRIFGEATGLNRLALAEGHRFPELMQLSLLAVSRALGIITNALNIWSAEGLLPGLAERDIPNSAPLCLSMMVDKFRIFCALGVPVARPEIDDHVDFAARMFLRSCGYERADLPK